MNGKMNTTWRRLLPVIVAACLSIPTGVACEAGSAAVDAARIRYPIFSPDYPVVLQGRNLPSLLNVPIGKIGLFAWKGSELTPIPFQIDRRDGQGRFLIPDNDAERRQEGALPFDEDDECAFMAADLGSQGDPSLGATPYAGATQIELIDPKSGRRGWVYALVLDETPPPATRDYVVYDRGADAIESDTYRIAFSPEKPFLVDRLHWRVAGTVGLSPDLADTMKVHHTGKLFHQFDFVRTQLDCRSTLVGVKDGPVRIIRSTSNRVRIILQVKSPIIRIDYIAYPSAFFMDAVLRIPFRIGTFFSDVKTLMTLDGNNHPSLPTFHVFSPSFSKGLKINGEMTDEKRAFNGTGDREVVVASPYGKILIGLQVARDFPIDYRVYLMDDLTAPDPPEEIPGQIGNVGFMTTGWEYLKASSYHMVLTIYMIRNIGVGEAFRTLRDAPSFVN